MRQIFCLKLKKESEALTKQPYPGELGARIYESISKEAWKLWLIQQTILINENRLNLLDDSAQQFLETEMQKYLFESKEEN
jgi:Fe-S cluster biosynthesis and repair protein YggX